MKFICNEGSKMIYPIRLSGKRNKNFETNFIVIDYSLWIPLLQSMDSVLRFMALCRYCPKKAY